MIHILSFFGNLFIYSQWITLSEKTHMHTQHAWLILYYLYDIQSLLISLSLPMKYVEPSFPEVYSNFTWMWAISPNWKLCVFGDNVPTAVLLNMGLFLPLPSQIHANQQVIKPKFRRPANCFKGTTSQNIKNEECPTKSRRAITESVVQNVHSVLDLCSRLDCTV